MATWDEFLELERAIGERGPREWEADAEPLGEPSESEWSLDVPLLAEEDDGN